ncbi:TetR/AcrR family transcriptional regulator [Rhodococcus sp. NPDC127528]|uniref:TetR/AcrR family transcriptional regulator n=1 Tax=unclassified Rhodococcus (in: high G+C Gram-positive bacteria) TaxID=192944 RepID=UPI00362E51AD
MSSEVRRSERADAARNRRAILDAAARLLAERGPSDVSMEQIAAAAGVGKGTLFHRFGSRAGLMRALVLERAEDLRRAVVDGAPPLGPGAPAGERLLAYFDAMTDLVVVNIGLVVAYDTATEDPHTDEIHAFWYRHIADLLSEARPDVDADMFARLLLGTLGGELVLHLIQSGQTARLKTGIHQLVESVLRS